ncbi:hypothetical protein PC114_g2752 [Phytophthora cactorum]|nr:hypothetical protein PC114_g2752 [Phytophthora cactorum]
MRYALYLILLLLAGYHSIVHAVDATVSASWSNATVSAAQILELVLTTGDDPLLPADALLEIQLNSLFTVASDAGVDEAVLRETLSGTWSVTVDTSAKKLTVQRSGDGAEMASTTHIRFKLTGVTNPSRAGRISVGTIEISDTGAQFTRTLQLPTMEIEPGVIWNAQLAFSNLLSGRSASVMIHMTLPHVVPNDGVIAVYFPYMYGSMSGVTLSSVAGLNGDFIISTTNNAIWIKRDVGSGTDSAEVQDVVIELEGITHPLVEGPLGPSVLLQTLDAASRIIDQTYVDTSDNVLAKARVVLSSLSLRVTEGDVTGAQYTVSLSAPPYANTALTLSVGDSATRAKLTLDPDSLVFSASNWSTPAKITVTASNDFVVSGTSTQESTVRIGHTIISGDSGNTFAAINEVNVHISENDFPAVHISDRFLAVVERLRNDSYQISLLSQPSSEVIVQMTPQDSFIETFPDQVVFTASSWNTPKVINVSPVLCQLGSYSLEDDHVCHVCPAGSYCPDQYSAALNCATGTYSLGNATVCTPCGAGVKCSIDAAPVACAAGYYSINASTPCLLCDAGSYCPSTTLPPTKCVQGTYSHSGAVACTACPYGYTCTTSGDPVACALGETNNADHSACISCPKGYECSPLKSVAMTCATGTYSLDGDGYYSPTGSGSCVECPRGYYCDTPNEMPKNCSVGYYSLRASTSCLACDPGYECPRSDQLPQPCPVGYYSEGAVANCRSCYPGYKCSLASTNPTPEEDACPMGGYCNPPTTFFLCPAGTFGNVTAGESIDHACAPCPEGYYCEMGTTPLTRQTCPAGFFCPEGTKRASQNPCPAGTYNPNQGQKSSDVCQVCPAGSYCPTGSSQPQPCPQGYYCLEGTRTVNQYPCPAGTFSGPQTGLTIGSQCNECPLGSYCPEASSTPTKCPAGRYNPKTGAADLHECLDCPPGWSCPHVGQSDYVDRCAKGHYCPGGTVLATDHPCPAGTYTESVELIRSQDCIICPLRHSCLQGTGGETQTMLDCGPGFFCPNGTAYPNQFPCLPGTWSSSTSLSVAAECDICPPGKYCQGGKSFIDGSCAPGHYCPLGTYSSTQFPCPSGTYTANTWLFEPSQCDDCPPGYYCPAGSVAPIPCKAGSYTSVNNTKTVGPADAWPACITCPAGYYCIEASVTPKACGKGKFSSSGSKACSTCEAGYFCNSETTSAANMRSNALGWSAPGALYGTCYNGTYCPAGSDSEPALETDACPPGYYCPTATPSPIICPADVQGLVKIEQCEPCPSGQYCDSYGLSAPSGPCLAGFVCSGGSPVANPMGQSYGYVCPAASYCPDGTGSAIPCPVGSFRAGAGGTSLVSCSLCPGGKHCSSTGLTAPSGSCSPGYYCVSDASTPTPVDNVTGAICPPGFYCPEASPAPIKCSAGTYAADKGQDTCDKCPMGYFCDGVATSTYADCPAGHYCPTGTAEIPVSCPVGTFSNSIRLTNVTECQNCTAGSFCATMGLVQPTGLCAAGNFCPPRSESAFGRTADNDTHMCSAGAYCPEGTYLPIPCPTGTYSNDTGLVKAGNCIFCDEGSYCTDAGLVKPTGLCDAGYYCKRNNTQPNPSSGVVKVTTQGSELVAYFGGQVCPIGSYCPQGAVSPILCPEGFYSNVTGSSTCLPCPPGFFCPLGCSDYRSNECPIGHYCPECTQRATQFPCPPGSFGDRTGLQDLMQCTPAPGGTFIDGYAAVEPTGNCRSGFYCSGGSATGTPAETTATGGPCLPGTNCPEGSAVPIVCDAGAYCSSTNTDAALPCKEGFYCVQGSYTATPTGQNNSLGKFCVAGTVTASCTAGYYCKLRNDHPNPVAAITNGTADGDMTWRTELGGPCPIGYYCPEGVLDPFPCPKNSSRLQTLGIAESDCDPCPAGKSCNDGTNTVPCPAGSYCPYGVSDVPCPAGTFNGAEGKANQEDCVPCDAGKLCNRTGILDLTDYDCPPGNYCLRGSFEPQPCPAGQYRAVSGAKSSDDCLQCIGGSYCEAGVTQPTVCNATTYCPVGVGSPRLCPGGSYCPYNTTTPVTCPEGFFCSPAVDSPSICTLGHYCPSGTTAQIPCPLGYLGRTTPLDGAYTSLYSSCEACPPGTFGIDVNRTRCDECLEGFVCLGATNSSHPTSREVDRGYPCPTGYYCPAGSSSEIACPRGTYQPSYKASNESACLLCPENSYQNSEGQASCLPCSTSAFAGTGATKCTCVGSHRAFQMTDGYCICEPGYEFYDQDMILRSDEDGDVDCQPIVYDRCSSNQVRSDSGSCVSASGKACDATCNNGTGTYVASLGVCQCDEQPDLDTVCNKKCRDEATQIQVNSSTGELQLYNPVTGEVLPISDEDNTSGLVSKVSCTSGSDCQLHSITVASTGFSGSYDLPPLISDATSRRRRLTTASTSSSIANPMVCLSVGGGLLFDLSVPRSYPIYMKDSMLNTNPSFDYGAFRSLATKVNANTSTVSAFAFSFTEPGTYVFGNSLNSAAQTIVVVMKTGTSCPTEAPIVPLNEKNLVTVSAKRRTDDIILAPDWGLIMGLLGGLFGVVIAVIGGLYYFRAKSWTNTAVKSISGYRAKNKQVNLAAMHSKGTVAVTTDAAQDGGGSSALLTVEPTTGKQLQLGRQEPMKGTSMEYHADLGRWDEEDLDLRELVDRLQFHHEAVTKNFEDQKGDVKQLMQHLHAEAIELKRLFVNALVASDLMSTSPDASKEDPGGSETTEASETLPVSKISGRLRSKSVAGREKFLLENLERDLQDREQFEQKKTAMLGSVSADLREVEGWSAQLAELTGAIVQEMSSPVDDRTPESTSTNEESCLEHTRMVLDDLKTLLGSDPMTQTSSSLVHLAEQEKGRREVGNFVLEASQRYFTPRSAAQDSTSSNNVVHRLLELHDDVEKTQNKEDEALFGPLSSLQKFGAALPQVLATIDDLETSFRRELDAVREEQNPVKERAVQAQMQSRLSKLLKEVAAGAKKVNERLEKEAPRTIKLRHGAQHAEDALSRAVTSAKEQWDIANQEQRDRIGVATSAQDPEEAVVQTPSSVEELAASKLRDDTLFQIKDLLVGLTTLLRTNGVPLMAAPQQLAITAQPQSPPAWVDSRVVADAKRNNESATQQSAAEYASELTVSYPQLSAVDKERLLDDFASDLRTIQSSVSVEATRTQAELATRQAATEALVEAKRAYVQRREQEDADVLRAQHDEEEQSLESQFRDEELAIEQEYLKELSSLEMEFGSDGGDEAVRDFAGSPDTMFDDFANGMEGDESSFPGLTEAEDIADILDSKLGIPVDDNADIIAQLNDVYSQAWNDRVRILAMEEALKKEQLNERLRRKRNALKGSTDAVEEGNLDTSQPEKELNELMLESSELKEEILEEIVKKQDDMDVLQQEAVNRAVERLRQQVADCEIRSDVNEENDLQRSQDALTELVIAARHAAQADKVAADKVIAHTEDELQMLQNEYDRDFMALREEIENERLRLNAKMQSALSAKRRRGTTKDEKGDDEVFAEQTDGDLVEELETQLEEFTNTAIEELRDKHFQLQQKVEAEKTQATVAVAVAEAQLAYLDELPSSGQVNQATTKTISLVETPRSRVEVTEELLEALANRIPVQIELQFQEELDKLHVDYMLACAERRRELEADAAMRRAKLAEKMNRRRLEKESNSSQEERKHQPASSLAEALDAQEQVELAKIDEELKAAIAALDDYERQGGETLAKSLASTLHSCGKEVEGQIRQCRQQHEVAASLLKPADDKGAKELANTVVNVLDALESEASQRAKAAAQAREAIEHEIERLQDESSSSLAALTVALDAEKRRQEQRLKQRMKQRREQQQTQLPVGSSPEKIAEMNAVLAEQEMVERQKLEDQLETQAQLAFDEERGKQREHEDRLAQQLREATVAEIAASTTKEAVAQARNEYLNSGNDNALTALMRLWRTRQPSKSSVKEATKLVRKRSVASRLAALAAPSLTVESSSVKQNVVADTMAAEMEQQIKALSASHLRAWQQRQQELQEEEARRKAELESRLRRKRDAKLHAGSQQTDKGDEEDEQLHQQLVTDAIKRKFAMEAEIDMDLELIATAVQSAGGQTTSDIEALLAACHSTIEAETAALGDTLRVQRQAQEEALRQRLQQRRRDKVRELESTGKSSDPSALAALEDALKEVEATELRSIAGKETQQLSALHERLRSQVGAAFAEADRKAKRRCDDVNARLASSEEELNGIYREHEEGRRALRESLGVEQRRQQDKLLERMARRRAERLADLKREHPNDLSEAITQKAMLELNNEHEGERLRLEDGISEQTTKALQELDDKTREKETFLQAETRRLRAEAEAAQAAREALAVAHCAEAERVTREFYACLGGGVDVEKLKAQDRRRRIEERLATKHSRKTKVSTSSGDSQGREQEQFSSVLPAETQSIVVDDLESELQRLHDEHDREWGALKARLDDETRLRKAQLAERLQRKRQSLQNNTALSSEERQVAEAALDRAAERESLEIDASAALAARALRLAVLQAKEQAADTLTASFASSSDELDTALEATRKQHDEAQRKLRETLEMERRKQEQLFQERRRQRRAARRAGTEPMPKQGTEEAEEEGLKRELETQLCAEQAQAWTALREREQQDVEAVLAPLEAAVGRRLDDAELAERRAREELERLAEEHDRRLAELRESLEAEKKRQQLALREKLRRKRDQRRADGVSMPDEEARGEERQAMEALETSFETNLASAESEALENRREKGTELLAQVCALSASRAAEEAALTLLDAARLEAERVREEYEAALASRVQVSAVADAISREEMAKRLADRRQKRRQDREQQKPREITVLELTPNEPEDGGSVDREIAVVQAAHARGVKSRRDQLDAETAARKAALAARLEHKRRAARQSGESGKSEAEIEKALLLEEQEELAAIEQERVVEEREIEAEASREKERLAKTLREADERGAADIEQQLSACKQAHDTESAKLEEALRAERARQELALKQRLNAKRQRIQAGGGGATDKDSNDTEATNEHEVQAAQAELEEQERVARQQLTERQQQELADVARKLEQETEAQRLAAFDLQAAAERELKRLEEEHARERRALQEALLADQRKRETQLREKLAKKKAARQAKGSSDRQDEEDAEEGVAMAALQEEIMQEQAEALGKERERQETAMRLAAAELQEAATASAKAAAASRQAQEEAARVAAEFDRHRGEAQQLQTAEAAHSKSKLADRLAEKKNKRHLKQQQKQENDDGNAAAKSLEDEAERLRLEAQIEAQLVACREAHDAEAAKLRESLQAERERQERALQERIARRKEKRNLADAQASTKADVKAAEEAELKQQQEEEAALAAALAAQEQEAWDTIERKQGEDIRVLQEQKQQQERERAVRQQQQAQQEMNRLQEEHERELRALTASLAQEQARQEEKLQQRIAQRRARKQRQEEETAGTSAKAQQSNVDAEEEARITAESQRAKALAQAQAQAEAEAEEKERQEIAARLALKLEEERARQRREKEELEARLNREAEEQAAKRAEALALQLQQQAIETADKMAHEFNTNLRELRETHSADGAAQKARLESRIAAKKTRKLRELEEKRELERQRLHARQQQEAEEAAKAEKEREEALAEAARQAAIPVAETIVNDEPAAVAVLCPAEEKAEANRQQQQDVAAVQQLFTYGLVPGKLSLLGAVELVVGARHERELAVQLVELATKTLDNVRQALQAVTQQKAARKAQALQEISSRQASSAETDTVLSQIDAEFAEKLREAECLATEESEKTKREAEKRLKERQMREVAFLLAHFDAQHTEALTNVPAIATQVQPLQQQPQQPTMTAAQREAEDLVAELRARLELEADERRRELEEEKRLELERLAKEEQDQLAQVEAGVAALLAEERAAMARLQVSRLQKLPPGAVKQREAAERERTAQLQRLTLMLEGRGRQQKDRVRARIVQQKALIEDEFRRKGQIIIAVMNQRLVQEKAGLRQRQELLKPYPENAQASDQAPQQQDKDTSQSMLTDELAKRLEDVLEERLAKIEALVADFKHNVHDPPPQENTATKETNLEEDSSSSVAYRLAVAEAVAAGCRYEKLHIADKESLLASSAFGVLDANAVNASKLAQVSANKLDDRMRVRRDFAELLLQAVAAKDEPAAVLAVVELFGRENNGRADYASFSPQKKSKGTLYLSLAALQDLSTGQLAVVMLHALAQARANTSDLTEPQFVSHLYNLLVRCYQGLFLHVQQQQRATSVATASTVTEISRKSVSDGGEAGKTVDTSTKVQWQARLLEMEGFLTRMGSQKAAIQRSQSSQLRLLPKQREGDNAGEASASMSSGLWQQEQGQVLQEKLDTAEKLYLQVLRQHEQQTQTVEYWQDLLAEQREAEYEEDAFDEEGEEDSKKTHTEDPNAAERQQQREARAQEAQSELDGASQVLEATRKERDELFAQCQQLRDQLNMRNRAITSKTSEIRQPADQAASDGGAMAKERISSEELAQRKEEYYELLATSDSTLQDVLNQRGGLVLARVGRYQPWPARFSEPGEFAKMARYRAKKGQACVYFFGSRNYGWVSKSSIQPFPEDLTTLTASNKYNQQHIQDALDEAKLVMDVTDETGKRFFDRIMERKEEAVDLPCERCNRVDDHYSLLILCDGKNCKREYHMNCLTPPLVSVPPGEWFCPDCEKEREKEREKELQKRAKAEAIDSQDSSVTAVNGLDGTLPLAKTPSTKKTKKHKHNSRDGIVKRRLSSVSPDRPGGPVKKPRGHRSSSREVSPPPRKDPAMPKKLDGRKKKPSQLSISSSRAQLLSDPDNGTADDELRSEEKCLICGFGGELIVCEFTGCTKVYHQFCLGAYPFPKDEDATWYCPRHTCALTGEKESCEDGEKSTNKLKHASPRKPNVKNLLWKCNQCPLAISDGALPQLPQGQVLSKKSRTFLCSHCYLNASSKVQLSKRLEKIWSTLATNRQGMPFCGPLLCGVEPVDGQLDESRTQLDLFKVLARIRRLEYEDSAAFSRDIDEVVANAVDLIANRSYPLMEAAKTLKIIRNEQFAIHQQKLDFLDSKIRRVHADRESGRDNEDDLAAKRWPFRWRQECGPFEDKYYPRLEAKSLDEWTALVSAAPLYASADEFDGRSVVGAYMSDEMSASEDPPQGHSGSARSRSPSLGSANELSDPPAATRMESSLTLSEGTDVMLALGDLSKPGAGIQKRRFGGEQTKELDSMDAREFFLSPSTSEMQHVFDQQSTLLRSALEAHSTLQRSWLISQQDMLGLGGNGGFSVGEGRLAAELRLANKNLRQRLRNKDKLVDQLTSDHMALRAEVINLQRELSQSKSHARELEDRIAVVQGAIEGRIVPRPENHDPVSNGDAAATPDRSTDEEHLF